MYYAILAAVTVVVVVVVFAAGSDEKTQPAIAGGYDVAPPAARCTGLQMDVTQSGEFVGCASPTGRCFRSAAAGRRLKRRDMRRRRERALVATVAVKGSSRDARRRAAARELKRDPPAPGACAPRPPPSIAGKQAGAALGLPRGAFELEKAGATAYDIRAGRAPGVHGPGRSQGASRAATRACGRSPGRPSTAT